KISKSFEIISDFAEEANITINYDKSDGISLLKKPNMPSEFFNAKEHIEFLGYKISVEKISIKDQSIKKIKKQISFILYKNLIKPLRTYPISEHNFPLN